MNMVRKLFLAKYATIKNLLGIGENKVLSIFAAMLTTGLLSVLVTLFAPFLVFRMFMHTYLRIAYGKLYGGLLNGMDIMVEVYGHGMTTHFIVVYTCNNDDSKRNELLRSYIDNIHKSNYKLSSRIRSICGYLYFVKDQVKSEEILEIPNFSNYEIITRTMVYEYIESHSTLERTNVCWRLIAFSQPVYWSERSGQKNQYVAIITLRHSLGDGPSMISLLKQYIEVESKHPKNLNSNIMKQSSDININNAFLHNRSLICLKEGRILKINGDSRIFVTMYAEEKPRLVSIIKAIRRELNVEFVDVLMAAISSSVRDYILQRKKQMTTMLSGVTVRLENNYTNEILNGTYRFEGLRNNFIILPFFIPFVSVDSSMKNKIIAVNKLKNIIKTKSVDYWMLECLEYGMTYLPSGMVKLITETLFSGSIIGITNSVGFQKGKYCNGDIDEIFLLVTNAFPIFIFEVFSYDNRLEIGASSGRGYLHNRKELETIVEGALKYLDIAEKEILHPETYNYVNN